MVVNKKPVVSLMTLIAIIILCFTLGSINNAVIDLSIINMPPSFDAPFGTDHMGRNIFTMIWEGGINSILIGLLAGSISMVIGILYGSITALLPKNISRLMENLLNMIVAVPSILIVIFLQGILGSTSPVSLAIVIGISSWTNMARVVQSEVTLIKESDYILSAKAMNGGFFYILKQHILPNLVAPLMFMVVNNIIYAITEEATLSFLGIGLKEGVISWGTMLSMAERAITSNLWWLIVFPGLILAITLISMTNVGEYLRRNVNKKCSNL